MDTVEIARAAADLHDAYTTPIGPLSDRYPDLSAADAYRIQLGQVDRWTAAGRQIRGYKVGLTSLAMQRQLGVDQPDFGHLRDDMFHPESVPIPIGQFHAPKIEPEIAFVLGTELAGPGVTTTDAISAVAYAVAALEIIDSRILDWNIQLADTIADNASAGGVVIGSRPLALSELDLRLVGCNLTRSGAVVATGAGAAVMGSPINALVWLANTMGRLGTVLPAGSVILSGSLTAAVGIAGGDAVTVTFGQLGSVTASFSQETS